MPQDASGTDKSNKVGLTGGGETYAEAYNSASIKIGEAITGEYSALDEVHQRQDAAVFGNCIEIGAFKTAGGAVVHAFGDAELLASGEARVFSRGHAKVACNQGAMVVATDHVKVTASGTSSVLAYGDSKVYASDDACVMALDGTEVYASGRVRVRAFGYCTVYASGDSQVEVAEPSDCTVYLYGNAVMHTAKS